MSSQNFIPYTDQLGKYTRLKTREVQIGDLKLGGDNPVRVQSMTNTDTLDTEATVKQVIELADAGCDLVRITAPNVKSANNLENIKKRLHEENCFVPIVADIHFTPGAAEIAARLVEKVRVNPGNYADKKNFKTIEYDDNSYQTEIERIRKRFAPLVDLCKKHGTAMRIGTNHGSLSDRIMSRYGDSPRGMVESALEFLNICEDMDYYNIVLSMKASNTQVMVHAYRLLVAEMIKRGRIYPLHLGVTEAGGQEEGRIKSAMGIGTLLADGLGDTIRVSLTEDPVEEVVVAKALADYYESHKDSQESFPTDLIKDPYMFERRKTHAVKNIGSASMPKVVWKPGKSLLEQGRMPKTPEGIELECEYFDMREKIEGNEKAPVLTRANVLTPQQWQHNKSQLSNFPLFETLEDLKSGPAHEQLNFLIQNCTEVDEALCAFLKDRTDVVLILKSQSLTASLEMRAAIYRLMAQGVKTPVLLNWSRPSLDYDYLDETEKYILPYACDFGLLFIDGLADGLFIDDDSEQALFTGMNILQASRLRMSRTEYISCPSCGRTLFDLQEVTNAIRKRTGHLKGVKIGVMGCIVNGPGEMADADFGYVGTGPGKISLYKGHTVVQRNVPEKGAVDALIDLIKEHDMWKEPEVSEAG